MDEPDLGMEDPADYSASLRVATVTASLGPAGPLLRQLRSLTTVPDVVSEDEIQSLRKDLEGLCITLMEQSEAEEPCSTAKSWMSEVRELCFDTKNYFDDAPFILKQDEDAQLTPKEKQEIAQLKFKTLEARASHAKRYKIDWQNFKKAKFRSMGRRRLPVLHAELIDRGRMDTLANMLGTAEEKQLKAVSLIGLEGVGKTTLAKRLYHQTGGQFQCQAFVRVSPNPDVRMLLTSIFTQIQLPQGVSEHACCLDAQDLITKIEHYLRDKRYLIIIDDIWTISVWDIIRRAFPDDSCGSRIVTTTQIEDVASACCSYQSENIFEMEPLKDYQSRKLFFSMVLGSEDHAGCSEDFVRISGGIISKCGGLPLLIVNVASLLATPSEINLQQWMDIQGSLTSTMRTYPTSEGIKEVINLIYNNLSPELKTCLLYLAMYPEGYMINKDDLVNQWVVESFTKEGQNRQKIAQGYFDDLVSRGLIQAVDINNRGVLSCTLHHMVHDFIVKKSMEGNFIIGVDYFQSAIWLPEKVRRLSVQFGGARSARIPVGIMLSEVRSLAYFGFYGRADFIEKCKLLRVLSLHAWADDNSAIYNLSGISKLLALRYLKIACNIAVKLPDEIQALQYLETLEVDATVVAIPSGIGGLSRLSSLKIAARVLSSKDICILEALPALSALSLNVWTTPIEMIVFEKGGFPVLEYFKFRCHVPWLKFETGSMPDLRILNLCFNAHEAHQLGIVPIGIEHMRGLNEITAEIWGADLDVSSTFRTAISNHPSNPRINIQLVDYIFYGHKTKSMGTKEKKCMSKDEDKGEDKKKQSADSRISTSSSRVPIQGGVKKPKLMIETENIEVKAQTFAYGPKDMANRMSELKIEMDNIGGDNLENFAGLDDMNIQHRMLSSPMNKLQAEMNRQPGWEDEKKHSDISDNLAITFQSPGDFTFIARSPFLHAILARQLASASSSSDVEGLRLELRELLGKEVEVGYEALQLVRDYLYSGCVVQDLPKSACFCVDEEGCAHIGCHPAVSFMAQVLFVASTFQVAELTNLFERRLLDVLDMVEVDNLPLILSVANLCNKSCKELLERCLEMVARSNLDMINLEKELPPDVIMKITDSRLSLGLVSTEDMGFPNKYVRRILRALDSDDVELVRMLLKEGLTNLDDAFALHYAVEHCDSKVTTELLDIALADVNHRNPRGYTVLHIAARRRDPKLVVTLLTKGARPSDLTIDGRKAVQISKRSTKRGDYFGITEEGKPSRKDKLCIEILEQAERWDPQLGEASISLAMTGDCLRGKLLYLENRVALASIMFPTETRIAMGIAEVDGTLEFTLGSGANPRPEIQRGTVDLNETPFTVKDEHLARIRALSKTVELCKRFFPRCSNVLDMIMDDDPEPASLVTDTSTSTKKKRRFQDLQDILQKAFNTSTSTKKKRRFQDLQDILQKAFSEDREFDRSTISSSSSTVH